MSINLDNLAHAGQPGGRTDRRNPDARQERWLLELEQAMFAQARSKPPRHASAAAQTNIASAPLAQAAPVEAVGVLAAGGDAAAALGRAQGVAGHAAAPAPCAESATQELAVDRDLSADTAPTDAAQAARETGAPGKPAGAGEGRGVGVWAHQLGNQAVPAGPGNLPGAAYGLLAQQALGPAGADAAMEVRLAARSASAQPAWGAGRGNMATTPIAQETPPDLPQAELPRGLEGEDAAAPDGARQAADDEYSLRNLHLYREGDTVQAWLRDSRVGPGQAQALARAVAAELAGEGAQLRALTVNGKPVALRGARGEKEQDRFADGEMPSVSEHLVKGQY